MRVHLGITAAHMTAGTGMSGSTQGIEGGMTAASLTGTGSADMIGAAAIETAASLMRGPRTDTELTGCSIVSAWCWQMPMHSGKSAFHSLETCESPTGAAMVSLAGIIAKHVYVALVALLPIGAFALARPWSCFKNFGKTSLCHDHHEQSLAQAATSGHKTTQDIRAHHIISSHTRLLNTAQ